MKMVQKLSLDRRSITRKLNYIRYPD